jgi:hypothetical protein
MAVQGRVYGSRETVDKSALKRNVSVDSHSNARSSETATGIVQAFLWP